MSALKKEDLGIAGLLCGVAYVVIHLAVHKAVKAGVEHAMPDPMVKIHEEQFRSTNERLQFSLDAARSKFSSEDLKPFYARIQQTRNSGKSHHDQAIEINRICMDLFKFAENAPTPTNGFRTAMQEESDNRKRFIERYGSFAGFRTNTAPPPRTK